MPHGTGSVSGGVIPGDGSTSAGFKAGNAHTMANLPLDTPTLKSGMLNLRGMVFGELTVVRITTQRHKKKRMWLCKCSCGVELVVRHDYLIHTNCPKTHCGCKNRGLPTLHPEEYHIWNSMLRRCRVPTHSGFKQYGGRGIRVCDTWGDLSSGFAAFLQDVGKRPSKGHSLDRINADGNYEPANVRWATGKEQARNKRKSIYLPHPETGAKTPAAEVAEFLGITYQSMRARYIKEGKWPTVSDAIKPTDS